MLHFKTDIQKVVHHKDNVNCKMCAYDALLLWFISQPNVDGSYSSLDHCDALNQQML